MIKFIWMYLILAISSFSYGEQIISVHDLVRELSANQHQEEFDDEGNPIEFYKPSEDEVSAIIWLSEEEEFFENQEGIDTYHNVLDININLPIVKEDTDINVIEELYGNGQNNYDIAGPFGGGGGEPESILDQQSLEENLNDFLDEDVKNAIVSTFGGGGGFALAQQLENINNVSDEDVKDGIASTFGGGGHREVFTQRSPKDRMNNLAKKLREYQNTQGNVFIYDSSKYITDKKKGFSQEIVGTFGGGGITPYVEHVSKEYLDNFSSAFVVIKRQSPEGHLRFSEDSYLPQRSFTEGYPVSRGFIDSNRISPVQLNMNGVSFQ